jgi:hypothetical protein
MSFFRILFEGSASHAFAHNIHEGEHPGLGVIDDVFLERREGLPARAPGINNGGDAHPKSKPIGRNGHQPITEVMIRLRTKKHVAVNVDKAGRDVHALGIHRH